MPLSLSLLTEMSRYWNDFDGEYKIKVMSWFIRKVWEMAITIILTHKKNRETKLERRRQLKRIGEKSDWLMMASSIPFKSPSTNWILKRAKVRLCTSIEVSTQYK